jgi:hypothetical protein
VAALPQRGSDLQERDAQELHAYYVAQRTDALARKGSSNGGGAIARMHGAAPWQRELGMNLHRFQEVVQECRITRSRFLQRHRDA